MDITDTVRTKGRELRHASDVAWRTLRKSGALAVARRATGMLHTRLGGADQVLGLHPEDIASSTDLDFLEPQAPIQPGMAIRVGWVMTPPAPGSGGHTTLFRMVKALEDAGHECVLFFYDVHGGSIVRHDTNLRAGWPGVRAKIKDATHGISGVDVCVATSWESAHVLARRGRGPMKRAYFIQDYEPFFYPMGWQHALAEDSYRFGYRCIALGSMIQNLLSSHLGLKSDLVEFGCDTSVYRLIEPIRRRSGVVFFARPDYPRRGYLLGKLALEEFHHLHPDQEIHVFGSNPRDLSFPVTRHGKLTPADLNGLYNRVVAGVVPSFTNVSLVPEEMLAAGVVPVCNESEYARACLNNPNVSWTLATPVAMAGELGRLVSSPQIQQRAANASASVIGRGWESAKRSTVEIIEAEAYGTVYQRA